MSIASFFSGRGGTDWSLFGWWVGCRGLSLVRRMRSGVGGRAPLVLLLLFEGVFFFGVRPLHARDADVTASVQKDISLDGLEADVERIEKRLNLLRVSYSSGGDPMATSSELKRQYDEATYLFLIEDYERAALLFHTVLQKADRERFADYDEVEFYLAESLALAKNFGPAIQFYSAIVKRGPRHPFYESAVVSLIEIYARVGDFERFERDYKTYIESSQDVKPTPTIRYARAKTLYARHDYAKAIEIFDELVTENQGLAHLAQYYAGTAFVAMGDYESALERFKSVTEMSILTKEQQSVAELAYLAMGRLYYERGEYGAALDAYQNISRDSEYFADALYEQSWTFIKKGDYDKAIRTIDILLLTFPDDLHAPRLKLIRGILLQRRRQYDDALAAYQRIVSEYTGVERELAEIMRRKSDILVYFNEILDVELTNVEASMAVPAFAARYALSNPAVARSLDVTRDIRKQEMELREASEIIVELEKRLDTLPPSEALVSIRRAKGEILALRNVVLTDSERLLFAEYRFLAAGNGAADAERLKAIRERLRRLSRRIRRVPARIDKTKKLVGVYEDQLDAVQRNLYKIEKTAEDLLAQGAAIEKYLVYARENGTLSEDVEQQTRFDLEEVRQKLLESLRVSAELSEKLRDMSPRIEMENASLRVAERDREQVALEIEKLHSDMARLSPGDEVAQAFFSKSATLWTRMKTLDRQLADFDDELAPIARRQLVSIRAALQQERRNVEEYGKLAQVDEESASTLAQELGVRAFEKMHSIFSRLVLEADFGITDVYWDQKEEKSREIDQNQVQRAKEIEALEKKFSSLDYFN